MVEHRYGLELMDPLPDVELVALDQGSICGNRLLAMSLDLYEGIGICPHSLEQLIIALGGIWPYPPRGLSCRSWATRMGYD